MALTALQRSHNDLLLEALSYAIQGFVAQDYLSPTTVTGTPTAGTFHSNIINRAPLINFANDLGARCGTDRFMVQQIFEIPGEYGNNTNGTRSWGAMNDEKGMIRFCGVSWNQLVDSNGARPHCSFIGDFVEFTFYGTSVNFITFRDSTARDFTWSIDGGSATAVSNVGNSALAQRNAVMNAVIPIAKGLTLGVHTLRITATTTNTTLVYGFEYGQDTSNVIVNPGSAYINGQKVTLSSQQSFAYNSGVTGTKGGRKLVYLNADGTIGHSFRATDATQLNLTAADHTNEEIARTYFVREFNAARGDDIAFETGGGVKAYTIDDNVTTVHTAINGSVQAQDYIYMNANSTWMFTFVGTGLDILMASTTGSPHGYSAISIDGGASIGTISFNGSTDQKGFRKIVSGLPYGTHCVKFTNTALSPVTHRLVVYQPKKPVLPANAFEIADYNVMADYVFNNNAPLQSTNEEHNVSQGVIRKSALREVVISGSSWAISGPNSDRFNGFTLGDTGVASSFIEFTFWGTGFENRTTLASGRSSSIAVTINGLTANTTNFPTITGAGAAGLGSFNNSTGVMSLNNGTSVNGGVRVSGLPLNRYTVRLTNNNAPNVLVVDVLDILTPIHSHKQIGPCFLQNVAAIGNCSVSDNRKTDMIPGIRKRVIGVARPYGQATAPSTSSTVNILQADLSQAMYFPRDCRVKIESINSPYANVALSDVEYNHSVDGNTIETFLVENPSTGSRPFSMTHTSVTQVAKGWHWFAVGWRITNGASGTDYYSRRLTVQEID